MSNLPRCLWAALPLACVLGLASSPCAWSRDWVIDPSGQGDATTIVGAVKLAAAGDSILVRAGEYRENVFITGAKAGLFLRGEGAPGAVTIRADTVAIAIFNTAVPVRIANLTLTSTGSTGSVGTVYTQNARAEIRACVLKDHAGPGDCHKVGGGAVFNYGSDVLLEGCRIENNRAWESPGGVLVWQSRADIRDNVFVGNEACYGGGLEIYHCATAGQSVIERNLFLDNRVENWGGGIFVVDSSPAIRRNTFVGNAGPGNAAVWVLGGRPEVSDNIMQDSPYGVMCQTESGFPPSTPVIGRNLVWHASGGAVHGCPATGEIVAIDPHFCAQASADFTLCENSPAVSEGVAVMGAFAIGCAPCDRVPVERSTWGSLKTGYR
jgi:hypothetical protein